MKEIIKRIEARFFKLQSIREPVREWLLDLDQDDRKIVGIDIKTVEFGWPIGMPVCKPLGRGLFEVRSTLKDGRITRILFTIKNNTMILLHAFIKKSQKTPDKELELAYKRLKELTRHEKH